MMEHREERPEHLLSPLPCGVKVGSTIDARQVAVSLGRAEIVELDPDDARLVADCLLMMADLVEGARQVSG